MTRLADTLRTLAKKVERLAPSPSRPLTFHEAKSEIGAELERLAEAQR